MGAQGSGWYVLTGKDSGGRTQYLQIYGARGEVYWTTSEADAYRFSNLDELDRLLPKIDVRTAPLDLQIMRLTQNLAPVEKVAIVREQITVMRMRREQIPVEEEMMSEFQEIQNGR